MDYALLPQAITSPLKRLLTLECPLDIHFLPFKRSKDRSVVDLPALGSVRMAYVVLRPGVARQSLLLAMPLRSHASAEPSSAAFMPYATVWTMPSYHKLLLAR